MNNIQEKLNQIKAKATTKKALRLHFNPTLNPELVKGAIIDVECYDVFSFAQYSGQFEVKLVQHKELNSTAYLKRI